MLDILIVGSELVVFFPSSNCGNGPVKITDSGQLLFAYRVVTDGWHALRDDIWGFPGGVVFRIADITS